jgi:hypothetical protein
MYHVFFLRMKEKMKLTSKLSGLFDGKKREIEKPPGLPASEVAMTSTPS